jgi:hypothetical protein
MEDGFDTLTCEKLKRLISQTPGAPHNHQKPGLLEVLRGMSVEDRDEAFVREGIDKPGMDGLNENGQQIDPPNGR